MGGQEMEILSLEQSEIDAKTPCPMKHGEMTSSEIVLTVNEQIFTSANCFTFMDESE